MPRPPARSKQKAQQLLTQLKRQWIQTGKKLNRLERCLPGYLSLPYYGRTGLSQYGWALDELEKDLQHFPDN